MLNTKAVFRWHFWLGLATGLFLIVIGVSGSLAVFVEEIDWFVTPALRVDTTPGAPRADLDATLATVRAAYPQGRVTTIYVSSRPAFAHVFRLTGTGAGTREVFVHPGTGQIQGDRLTTGGYTSTLRNFIRQLHVRMLMGLWGRAFVGVFGITLVLSCLTGLWIYRGWLKNLFRLRWRGPGERTRWSDLHKLVGFWSLLFNLVIGLTGAVYGLENLVSQIRAHWLPAASSAPAAPAESSASALVSRPAAGPALPLGQILAHAQTAFPDLAVRTILLPVKPTAPIILRGDVPSWSVQQSHVRRANHLALDPATGAVLRQVDGRDAKGWDRLYSSFDPLHFGYFGGMTTKTIWFILGLTPGVLSLTGAWLWWQRRRRVAAPPAHGRIAVPAPRQWPLVTTWGLVTLAAAYALVARDRASWAFTDKLFEHAVTKPVTLALVTFPVTGLLAWLALRWSSHRGRFSAILGLGAAWYLTLVTLFQ